MHNQDNAIFKEILKNHNRLNKLLERLDNLADQYNASAVKEQVKHLAVSGCKKVGLVTKQGCFAFNVTTPLIKIATSSATCYAAFWLDSQE